jgi:hypothetical protein
MVPGEPIICSLIGIGALARDAGEARFRFVNAPSPDHPKASMVAALSLAAAVRRLPDAAGGL